MGSSAAPEGLDRGGSQTFQIKRAFRASGPSSALRIGVFLLALLVVIGSARVAYDWRLASGIADQRREAMHRLELFASTVQATVKRLENVPATVQLSQEVQALLHESDTPEEVAAANLYLRQLNAFIGSLAVYVLNDRGVVLASSNTGPSDDSRIGEDVSFRPYFLDALSGRVGRHFAIGINGDQPGYFVSHPIRDGARVIGVAAVKIGLESINGLWDTLGAPTLLADANQVVILASRPAWRYTTLVPMPIDRRVDIQLTRNYSSTRLQKFPVALELAVDDDSQSAQSVLPPSSGFAGTHSPAGTLASTRNVDGMDWRVMMFSDLAPVRNQALLNAAVAALAAILLLLTLVFFTQRRRILHQRLAAKAMLERINSDLERKVQDRTRDLSEANTRLLAEVAERSNAEQSLRAAQDELVQAAKMATLGQIATGITHELTQPLGAIRTLSGNAVEFMRRGELEEVPGNLSLIARLADQMGAIIQPLKRFARKSRPLLVSVDVAQAMDHALFLYAHRLKKEAVEVDNRCRPGEAMVRCDANRLEQVLTNLVGNALDAMVNGPVRRLTLRAAPDENGATSGTPIRVEVCDTGCGFDTDAAARMFDPFYTTKPSGQGLGLGLTISRDIVREFDGELSAHARPDGGSCFVVTLPAAVAVGESGGAHGVHVDGPRREAITT